MVRDLIFGSGLGVGVLIWRWWAGRKSRAIVAQPSPQPQTVTQLKQELAIAQQKCAQALQSLETETEKRIAVERELAEVNQLSGDRVVQLAELIAENVDLKAKLEQLSQARPPRKKRTPKPAVENGAVTASVAVAEPEIEAPAIEVPFELDLSLIQQKQAETQTATELLQPIFTEEAPAAVTPVTIGHLDAAHSTFVQMLGQQTIWTREALAEVAQAQGLLLDGALEIINEAAFETCDQPLVEGDDPIEVDLNVLKGMS